MATTPQQFAGIGLDILTQWQQTTERLINFAAVFEARGGADQFNNAKHTGENLTPEQMAENEELDRLRDAALAVVTHHNELIGTDQVEGWLTPARKVRIAQNRTDY